MEQLVKFFKSQNPPYMQFRLWAEIKEDPDGGYVSYCPALDIVSQGDTLVEARANIKEAVRMVLEACLERGTLARQFEKAGFYQLKSTMRKRKPARVREVPISVKILPPAA